MMKAFVLFLLLVLSLSEAFACDSCQRCCSEPRPVVCLRPGALIHQLFSGGICPFAFEDCSECCDETDSYCEFSPCFGTWAFLCDQCGGGEKRFTCVRCGQLGARIQALLCPQCSSIRRCCVKCGKPGARIPARLCDQCGYGEKKKECVKCGKIFR
ncbi:MAG: hypothetical protein IJG38_10505 [Thermoguttaceae bacterium]|nr:hypothetical protein [Thermoguttaceae bacterium]